MKRPVRFFWISACLLLCSLATSTAIWAGSTNGAAVGDASAASDTLPMPDRWLAQDKLEHLGASAFFSGVCYSICRDFYHNRKGPSLYFSASFTLGLGICKEVYDRNKPGGRFSHKDLAVDVVGIGLGLLIATW